MSFIVRNPNASTFLLQDNYLSLEFAASEGSVNLENIFTHEQLLYSSISPNALYAAINAGDLIRRDDTDTVDVAAAVAFYDAVFRWDLTYPEKILITEASTMGIMEGGELSDGGGLTVDIAAGFGYLEVEPEVLKRYSWTSTSLVLPASSVRYIYVNSVGSFVASAARPDPSHLAILLGRVVTDGSGIELIDATPLRAEHTSNLYDTFHRDAIGGLYGSGSLVVENGTRQLDVGSGNYFLSMDEFNPSGGTAITWVAYYRDGAGGWTKGSQSTVSNAFYDDGTGTLAALTSTWYAKHTLYLVGEGALEKYFLVYAQAEYADIAVAEQASLPLPPTYFEEGVVPIASIIVQEGTTNIVQIRDERPVIGGRVSTISSTTVHANLLGLLADDHPQYLLVSGTRAMTGNLDMGGNDIVNVNLVDGVDVSAHASRHLPAGADPLTTAAAVTLNALTTNTVGVANSLSRSDHAHDIATGSPSTQTPDQANAEGTSVNLARADHIHNIPADAPTTTLDPTTTNAEGVGTSFARNDHTHAIATGLVGSITTIQPDDTAAAGTANNYARGDHKHAIVAATAITINANSTNTEGIATSFARSDHTHDLATGAPSTQNPDQANAEGTSVNLARADHIHNIPADAPTTSLSATTSNAEGTGTSFARNDHTHAILTGVVSTQNVDQTNATGTSANLARADHIHNIPTATPSSIGTANAQGTATTTVKSDHIHQGVHSLHANAGSDRFGDLSLQNGTQVTITDDGSGNFTVNATSQVGTGLKIKAGTVSGASFSGNPKTFAVVFGTAFASTAYTITITGEDARSWVYLSKATTGFTIDSQANSAISGEVSWQAIVTGESV